MICTKCGRELISGQKFCVSCGTPAQTTENTDTEPTAPKHTMDEEIKWFAFTDEKQVGPLRHSEIKELVEQGKIRQETLVWKAGMDKWTSFVEVTEFNELHGLINEAPPPIPASEEVGKKTVLKQEITIGKLQDWFLFYNEEISGTNLSFRIFTYVVSILNPLMGFIVSLFCYIRRGTPGFLHLSKVVLFFSILGGLFSYTFLYTYFDYFSGYFSLSSIFITIASFLALGSFIYVCYRNRENKNKSFANLSSSLLKASSIILIVSLSIILYSIFRIDKSQRPGDRTTIYSNVKQGDACDKLIDLVCNACKGTESCSGIKSIISSKGSLRYSDIVIEVIGGHST